MGVHDFSINPKIEDLKYLEKPSESEVLNAVKTLLRWTGDNPDRDGLKDTPKRVLKAYGEWFKGYEENPTELLITMVPIAFFSKVGKWTSYKILIPGL